MSRAAPSLRRTLLLYLGALSALAIAVLFFAARAYGNRAANQSYDHLLVSSALSILDSVALADGQWQVDLPYAALDMLSMAPEDRVFYRVLDGSGRTITGYGDLPMPRRPPRDGQPVLFDTRYSGEPVRVAAVARRITTPAAQAQVLVEVGHTRRAREALAGELVLRALAALALLSLLSAALVWLGVQRALRPLARLEGDLSRREPSDLRPLPEGAPQEMQQMVGALNRFMQRLQASNENLRAFMAEAAHQMRTPLAALRAQAQLGLDEDDLADMRRSLVAVERNATHMSRLLNQLLSDASVLHRSNLQDFTRCDLAEALRQALHDALPAVGPQPTLVLEMDPAPAYVRGDALLLREALKNLIDNALKHGGAQGPLEIALRVEPAQCVVTIADHGSGIPAAEANTVFARFARGAQAAQGGAGLGLAIVKRVADSHGAHIDLSNRPEGGLVVTLRLPRIA